MEKAPKPLIYNGFRAFSKKKDLLDLLFGRVDSDRLGRPDGLVD
jgi:hypothetical protein